MSLPTGRQLSTRAVQQGAMPGGPGEDAVFGVAPQRGAVVTPPPTLSDMREPARHIVEGAWHAIGRRTAPPAIGSEDFDSARREVDQLLARRDLARGTWTGVLNPYETALERRAARERRVRRDDAHRSVALPPLQRRREDEPRAPETVEARDRQARKDARAARFEAEFQVANAEVERRFPGGRR